MLELELQCNDPEAALEVSVTLDDLVLRPRSALISPEVVKAPIDDVEGDRQLEIVLWNKQAGHTVLDTQGNIIKDALITVSGVKFDGIDIQLLFSRHSVYTHDCNGTQPMGQHQFYDSMGCNGQLRFAFYTPFYLWLLENM